MAGKRILSWVPVVAMALATAALAWMAVSAWQLDVGVREGGDDTQGAAAEAERVPFATDIKVTAGTGKAVDTRLDWPWFRGADRTGKVVDEQVTLRTSWPESGPEEVWRLTLGEGYGGPAVRDGAVYVLDHDPEAARDVLRALALVDGKEIWKVSYPAKLKRNFGYTRTVPAAGDGFVVSIGPGGQVLAVAPETGSALWTLDMVADYGAKTPNWYNGQCPLVDDGKVVLAPGGSALLVAVDGRTGKRLWETPNPEEMAMTHASIGVAQAGDRRLYVYPTDKGLAAVDAGTGELVFSDPSWRVRVANIPTPLFVAPDRLFLTGGYEAGSRLARIVSKPTETGLEPIWEADSDSFGSHIQTPVFEQGCFMGVGENGRFSCLGEDGKIRWDTGAEMDYGLGPYIQVNDLVYALTAEGVLTLLRPAADKVEVLASAKVLKGPDAWAPLAYVDGLLLARDPVEMVCLKVSK